ncbi:hypothetical protein SteCoe_20642 [Stentor coeruleus]|uniref:Uncharacterized protein n=1 Tax=Stentor coeruleus TaxID=5963 RepID=A0A1R2BRA5_9CILI|nr:hypothetical protein SteCoe_20642 [Stentor coeruleus]
MNNNSISEDLKTNLCDMVGRVPKTHSIVVSTGKQSRGKSTFLQNLFQDFTIPSKSYQNISRGTVGFTVKQYENLVLVDMEGLESFNSDPRRDIFNLCSTFTIADIVLLHISHDDLENRDFINSFAFRFLQSAKTCLKYKEKLPQIILLIRDPRWVNKNKETSNDYDNLVENFRGNVNDAIIRMFMRFSDLFRDEALNNSVSEEEKKENINAVNMMNNGLSMCYFLISCYYCVYFNIDIETQKTHYYELKHLVGQPSYFEDSNFPSLFNIITETCYKKKQIQGLCDHKNYQPLFGIDSELVYSIQRILDYSSEVCLSHIIEHIHIDVAHNIFFKYFDENLVLRTVEYFNKLRRGIEKISEEIIEAGSKCTNELSILKIRNKHQDKIGRLLEKETKDRELMIDIISYFKYLSALSFANCFSLVKGVKNSYSFQTLESIFMFGTKDITSHQISKMKDSITRFRCLFYFDDEFEEILKILMKDYFKLNESIFSLYKTIIENTLQEDYRYYDVLSKQVSLYQQADYISNIEKMLEPLSPYLSGIHLPETQDFIEKLKDLHSVILLEKGKDLIIHAGKNIRFKELTETATLYSFTVIERLIPSFSGLIIGVISTATRTVIPNAVAATISTAASTAFWIPVIGWGIFGVTAVTSVGWILYSMLKKNDSKKISIKHQIPNEHYIIDLIILKDCSNGVLSHEFYEFKKQKFNYEVTISNDRCSRNSAFLKVKCILVISDGSAGLTELSERTKREYEAKYQSNY